MSVPILTFFNNKGGVGKTSLVYHLSWMFSELGMRVLAVDLDPQANLTAAFLDEDLIDALWNVEDAPTTIYRAIQPLTAVGDIQEPLAYEINDRLHLIPGDVALAGFEDGLSAEWPNSLRSGNLYRPFRILTAFWQVAQKAAKDIDATIILADVGPNLGAINRSALIASDFVVIPLGADLFSLQGLKNLGPTLRFWRAEWHKRLDNWTTPEFDLPHGNMLPLGYIVQQHGVRLDRPVRAYDRWVNRIPGIYRKYVLEQKPEDLDPSKDPLCLAMVKHYRSLVPMAQEVSKPIFHLTPADGAIGAHALAVRSAHFDFKNLARIIKERMDANSPSSSLITQAKTKASRNQGGI
jgi:cellulose biosynthesis protein BcsQ